MRARLSFGTSCAVLLVLLSGCGGDDDDDDVAKGAIGIDDLPERIASRLCMEITSCFDAVSLAQLFGDDGCNPRTRAQFEDGDFAALKDAIDAGRVDYDAEQAQHCLEHLAGVGCSFSTTRLNSIEACDRTFEGHAKLGDDCNVDAECEGQAFCLREDKCPGTCSEPLGPGEVCKRDDDCEDGLTCGEAGACAAPSEKGQVCEGDVGGKCRAGLACVGGKDDDGSAGTCRDYASLFTGLAHDTCDYDTGKLCGQGLSCIVDSIDAAGMPTLVCAKPFAAGAACKFGAPNPCPPDEYCSADLAMGKIDGTCTMLPAAGQDCATVIGTTGCANGLICESDARCHSINRLGQPCVSDDGCASKRCVAGHCQRPATCKL